jgi:hypothetical protein
MKGRQFFPMVVSALACAVLLIGAWQIAHGFSATPPDCARHEYNYNWACWDGCKYEFIKECLRVGGTVVCCYHYPNGPWECDCIAE